jgi:hypothetical protein
MRELERIEIEAVGGGDNLGDMVTVWLAVLSDILPNVTGGEVHLVLS